MKAEMFIGTGRYQTAKPAVTFFVSRSRHVTGEAFSFSFVRTQRRQVPMHDTFRIFNCPDGLNNNY